MGSTEREAYYFLPFGEEIVAPVNGRSTSMGYPSSPDALLEKFTGHARDTETANINSMTGLDWMRARYYSSSQGRFQSVDPANAGASPGDPQSWNGYSYVGNNPLNYRDPSGMFGEGASVGCAGGPVGCTIGLAADIICAIFCADIFRGGSGSSAAPKVMTGGGIGNSPEVWSERAPISGGGVNTGGVFGSGNTGGTVFSATARASTDEAFLVWRVHVYATPFPQTPKKTSGLKGRTEAANMVASIFGFDQRDPRPSCFWTGITATAGHLNPTSPDISSAGEGIGDFYTIKKFRDAMRYAAKTPSGTFGTPNLMYPYKSSTFRNLLKQSGRGWKVGGWATLDIALFEGLLDEIDVMRAGKCQ